MIRWTIEATCFMSTSENQRKTLFLSRSYLPCTFFGGGGKDFNFCPSPSLSFIYRSACTCSSSDHSDTDEQLFTQTAVTGNWIIQMESKQLITRQLLEMVADFLRQAAFCARFVVLFLAYFDFFSDIKRV